MAKLWYYEADLGGDQDNEKRIQRGIVLAASIQDLFWKIDEILDPYIVRLTTDISMLNIGWESTYTTYKNANGDDEIEDSKSEVDNDYDGITLSTNAVWYYFKDKQTIICDNSYKSCHISQL